MAGPPASASCSSAAIPASQVYVRHKVKAGGEVGFRVDLEAMPESATLADLLALVDRLNRSPRARRHPGPVAAAEIDGQRCPAARVRSHCGRQGRGWIRCRERRAAVRRTVRSSWRARRPASSSCSRARTFRSRPPRRRHRAQRHRGEADGDAAAAPRCHGHDLPFTHAGPAGRLPSRRHPGRGGRPGRARHERVRQAGRDGDRRRHESRHRSRHCSQLFPAGHPRLASFTAKGRCWSATCTPRSPRSLAR